MQLSSSLRDSGARTDDQEMAVSTDWGTDTNLDAIAALVRSHPELSVKRITPLLEVARREPHGS